MNAEKVKKYIVSWLVSYAQEHHLKGFVVGISGGIDSAVVSTLCAETQLPTLCIEMPIHQAQNQVNRAQNHIKSLREKYKNVTDIRIDLTPVFDAFVKQIPLHQDNALSLANTRARLRMTTLYYFAGLQGLIVVGTGNKIEDFGVGFFTKYGDGGVDISPIADLMKSQVYELAEILGVSQEIRQAPPTDGLFGDDRTDQDQLGATYDELEWAMEATQQGKTPSDFQSRQRDVLTIYQRLNKANQHKMNPIPICQIPPELK